MKGWRAFFVVAAIYNVIAGLPMLVAPATTLARLGQTVPDNVLTAQMAAWLIVVFGLGYALVARDQIRNRAIVLMGLVGKLPIAFLVWLNGGPDAAQSAAFLLALGDLVFCVAFAAFLWRTREPRA
jgi:hypothetical protein